METLKKKLANLDLCLSDRQAVTDQLFKYKDRIYQNLSIWYRSGSVQKSFLIVAGGMKLKTISSFYYSYMLTFHNLKLVQQKGITDGFIGKLCESCCCCSWAVRTDIDLWATTTCWSADATLGYGRERRRRNKSLAKALSSVLVFYRDYRTKDAPLYGALTSIRGQRPLVDQLMLLWGKGEEKT